jgi:hypothetical protein
MHDAGAVSQFAATLGSLAPADSLTLAAASLHEDRPTVEGERPNRAGDRSGQRCGQTGFRQRPKARNTERQLWLGFQERLPETDGTRG